MARPVTSPAAYSQPPATPATSPESSTVSGSPGVSPTCSRPRPPVAGRRPVATSRWSATTRSPPDSCTATPPATVDTRSALALSLMSTPSARSPSATSAPAKSGSLASGRSSATISVTAAPRRAHACAISTPTTPPPSTASRPGTSCAEVASREVQTGVSASPGMGGLTGSLPVHSTTACRAVSARLSPSGVVTVSALGPVSRARPRTTVRPAPSAQSTWPASFQCAVNPSRLASTSAAARCSSARTPGTRRAAASALPGRSRALLGMHAQ